MDNDARNLRLGSNLLWAIAYLSCACLSYLHGGHCTRRAMSCIDPYFLEAWLAGDSHGFRARGLLGVITHALFPGGPDVVVLSIVAMLVCSATLALLVAILYVQASTVWGRLAIGVLLASPLCSLFFEEAGDPLTVVFAAFLITVFLIRRNRSRPMRVAIAAAFCLLGVALHEASIFLFFPALIALAFAERHGPGRVAILKYVAIAAPALILVVLSDAPHFSNPDYRAFNSITGAVLPRMAEPFPPYSVLLREELVHWFGTPTGLVKFVLRFPLVWCMPLLGLLLVSGVVLGEPQSHRVLWRHWLYLTVCSAPLYVIAHDWGRFSGYTFWLAMLTTWGRQRIAPAAEVIPWPRALGALIPATLPSEEVLLGFVASLMLAADAVWPNYGINGMPPASLPITVAVAVAWTGCRAWSIETSRDRFVTAGVRSACSEDGPPAL